MEQKLITLLLLALLWLFIVYSMWRRSRNNKGKEYRPLSAIYLVCVDIAFLWSAIHYLLLYDQHLKLLVALLVVSFTLAMTLMAIRSTRLDISLHDKSNLVKVPMFLYRLLFYIYVPYLFVVFALLTLHIEIMQHFMLMIFMTVFKASIAGIYWGFTLIAFWRLYIQGDN